MEIPTQRIILEDGNQYIVNDNNVLLLTDTDDGCVYVPLENETITQQNIGETSNILRETENTINTYSSAAEIDQKIRKAKKKQLWQDICNEMAKYGYKVEADTIDKKFRNMKSRYLIIKDNNDKKKTTGTSRISWIYFDIMSEIFFDDKTVNPNVVMASTVPLNNDDNNDNNKKTEKIVGNISSPNVSDQENENLSQYSNSTSSSTNIFEKRKTIRKRKTPINSYRQKCIQVEEERNNDLKRLVEAVENNNTIQKQKLEVLRQYLASQEKS